MSTPKPPPGYRLLRDGEWMRKGDIYEARILPDGQSAWKTNTWSRGKWTAERYVPVARKIEEEKGK